MNMPGVEQKYNISSLLNVTPDDDTMAATSKTTFKNHFVFMHPTPQQLSFFFSNSSNIKRANIDFFS